MVTALRLSKLLLSHFRNYRAASLQFEGGSVVLTGANGSGKTNILEAISFLSPGKGLRQIAKLEEADQRQNNTTYPWTVAAQIEGSFGEQNIGTGRDATAIGNRRLVKVDGKQVSSQIELAGIFSVMWLTPQMDGLFLQSSSDRRRFLDRMVYNFNPEHASHVYSYEYSMRERAKLLQTRPDPAWLSALESKMAERAIAIAAARMDALSFIQQAINAAPTHFPKAVIRIEGAVEGWLAAHNALDAEEILRKKLYEMRQHDAVSKRTQVGSHRSDMVVFHADHHMPASSCSTGEQKALLLSILLAEARAKIQWKQAVPVLLLDEVVAHLDENRRKALFDELRDMGCQVFMTGTEKALFSPLQTCGQFLNIEQGRVLEVA
jgi:DNA replication and repair protein RecF